MKVPEGLRVGTCSHTGLVRGANEDDYLLATSVRAGAVSFVAAIADGMGGAAGGAEASRTALRALGATLIDGDPRAGMSAGFARASVNVLQSARSPYESALCNAWYFGLSDNTLLTDEGLRALKGAIEGGGLPRLEFLTMTAPQTSEAMEKELQDALTRRRRR